MKFISSDSVKNAIDSFYYCYCFLRLSKKNIRDIIFSSEQRKILWFQVSGEEHRKKSDEEHPNPIDKATLTYDLFI